MTFLATQRFRMLISLTKILLQARDSALLVARNRQSVSPVSPSGHKSLTISLSNRTLEAVFKSPATPTAAILIFHGIGDRLTYWRSAQSLLAENNIASLVFHYSGYGKSTGATTPLNLREDSQAAYALLRSLLPQPLPIHLLGFSLGTGIAVDVLPHLSPPPAGLILCQAFTSLRFAAASFAPAVLCSLLPDIFQTHNTIANIALPLLIVHGDADELFPTAMAQQIHTSAKASSKHHVELIHPKGFTHNDVYLNPTLDYWQPIIDFAGRTPLSTSTR